MTASNKLKELRFKNNQMSQELLAKLANTTRQTIIRIEKGEKPSLSTAFNIAKALGVKVDDIFLN